MRSGGTRGVRELITDLGVQVREYFYARGLRLPDAVERVYSSDLARRLAGVLCEPGSDSTPLTFAWAERVIGASRWPLLRNLAPLLVVDEKSFACVVASDLDGAGILGEGTVVRWHLDSDRQDLQAAVLDIDAFQYAESVAEELEARQRGLQRMLYEIGPAYELQYLAADKRPRDFVIRPVRIACQNVIVGLAAFA